MKHITIKIEWSADTGREITAGLGLIAGISTQPQPKHLPNHAGIKTTAGFGLTVILAILKCADSKKTALG